MSCLRESIPNQLILNIKERPHHHHLHDFSSERVSFGVSSSRLWVPSEEELCTFLSCTVCPASASTYFPFLGIRKSVLLPGKGSLKERSPFSRPKQQERSQGIWISAPTPAQPQETKLWPLPGLEYNRCSVITDWVKYSNWGDAHENLQCLSSPSLLSTL